MLFAGLQGQYIARLLAVSFLDGLPDEAARQEAHIFLLSGHKAQRRSSVAHGVAEVHQFANSDISPIFARRSQHAERSRLSDDGDKVSLALVSNWLDGSHIFNAAEEIGLLDDDSSGGCA